MHTEFGAMPSTGRQIIFGRTVERHKEDVTSVSLSQDGRLAVTTSIDKTARVWDTSAGVVLRRLGDHGNSVWDCDISHDGTRVVTSSLDGKLRLWEAASGNCVSTHRSSDSTLDRAYGCWMSGDGLRVIAVYGGKDQQKSEVVGYRWSLENKVSRSFQQIFSKAIRRLSVSLGLEILAFTTIDGKDCSRSLHIVNLHTFKVLRPPLRLANISYGLGPGISVAANALAVVVADTKHLRVLHPRNPRNDVDLPLPNPPKDYAPCTINSTGTRVLASTRDNSFSIWDVNSGAIILSAKESTEIGLSCAMSFDEKTIIIGRHRGAINIHEVPTRAMQLWRGGQSSVN